MAGMGTAARSRFVAAAGGHNLFAATALLVSAMRRSSRERSADTHTKACLIGRAHRVVNNEASARARLLHDALPRPRKAPMSARATVGGSSRPERRKRRA